jgi:hypothetical protein
MMFMTGHHPRVHLTSAAKAIALRAIRDNRPAQRGPDRDAPLVNHLGRTYLPIDKGVPLPHQKGPATARPFAHMRIGDSFFEPVPDGDIAKLTQRIKWDAKCYRPKRFDLSTTTENGQSGLRVWRVA